jgi:hypothetical protein
MRMNKAILVFLFASSLAAQVQIGKNVQIGSGATGVTSVSNSDGTLTISPTAGAVIAAINLAHINTWTATQTFGNIVVNGTCTGTGCGGGTTITCATSGGLVYWNGSAYVCDATAKTDGSGGLTAAKVTVTGTGIPIATGTTSNTDLAGFLTLSGGTQTYTFTATYATAPVCTATDTTATNAVKASASTTVLTITGTGTDVIAYICIGRT